MQRVIILMVGMLSLVCGQVSGKALTENIQLTQQEYVFMMQSIPLDAEHGFFGKLISGRDDQKLPGSGGAPCFFIIYQDSLGTYQARMSFVRAWGKSASYIFDCDALQLEPVTVQDMLYDRCPGYCTIAYFKLQGSIAIAFNLAGGRFSSQESTWTGLGARDACYTAPVDVYEFETRYDEAGVRTLEVHLF